MMFICTIAILTMNVCSTKRPHQKMIQKMTIKDDSDSIKLSRKMVQLKQLYLGNTCTHTCVLATVTYSYVQLRTVCRLYLCTHT